MLNRAAVPVLGALVMLSSPAIASTWYVNGAHGADGHNCEARATACRTIRHAISLATSGDTIDIAPATYKENLTIPFDLTLNGEKATNTIVDGGDNGDGSNGGTVFTVAAGISLTLSNLTIQHGNAGFTSPGGGGVANAGMLTVKSSNFDVNTGVSGGAIFNTGTVTVTDSNFSSNSPLFLGHSASCGAIDNRSTMTIASSTFYNNYASSNGTAGGAICSDGALTITGSTFSFNSSQGNNSSVGGAIYTYGGTLQVTNSTFSQNSTGGSGSAIYSAGGTVQISNSTFGNGFVSIGGGGELANAGGLFQIQNSIVDNTANGGNCAGAITSGGYNLSSDNSCGFNGAGDQNNANAGLGALRKNGGPTQTMALLKGSLALDAGNPAGCRDFNGNLLTTDQRGMPRPGLGDTTGCDLGAYESQTY